jgi:hypothetical protein
MRRASSRRSRRELRRFTAAERFGRLPGRWRDRGVPTVPSALRFWFARRIGRQSYFWVEELEGSSCYGAPFCAQTSAAERLTMMRWLAMNVYPSFDRTPWLYRSTREIAWAFARYRPRAASELYAETPDDDVRCVGATCLALARACAVRAQSVEDSLRMKTHNESEPARRFFERRLAALR